MMKSVPNKAADKEVRGKEGRAARLPVAEALAVRKAVVLAAPVVGLPARSSNLA